MLNLLFLFTQFLHSTAAVGLAPGLYCGLDTCYEVLNITRSEFNKTDLSKIYRRLARQYHPDRVKDPDQKEEAEDKFRLIATAYETLKDEETRKYYDYYLDNPEERYYNYYQYYRMRATPKVDVRIVILIAILLISAFQYLSAHQKYAEALRYAKDQPKYRHTAIDLAHKRGLIELDPKTGKIKKKQKSGVDAEVIISKIIEENISISGGYKKHSVYDTLVWQIITLPLILFRYLGWWLVWIWRFWIRKEEYDEEAKFYLIRRYMKMSEDQFQTLDDKLISSYFAEELWKKENFEKWKATKDFEEKEKLASSGRYRQYKRQMKKQAGSTISFLDE
ncbi:dnaJ domain-containing protein [Ditylenchus destructor]|nr:dnaJ domain-containing protein [Ditylenchus destructor]